MIDHMSSDALSHAEFAATGGGSRRFLDGTTSQTGYYVSRHPAEGGEKVVDRRATAVDVAAHWSHNRRGALSGPHPREVYQGLWTNKEGTQTHLDVSDRLPSRGHAVEQGIKNNQQAMYDANEGKSIFLDKEGTTSPTPTPASTHIPRPRAYYSAQRKNGRLVWN